MIPNSPGRTALAALALIAALAGGCSNEPATTLGPTGGGSSAPGQSSTGALDVALALPPYFKVATINYQLTNTGFSKSGSLDVSQTQAITGVLGGIPAGSGYTLALTATDTAQKFVGCSGSSPVTVVGGATTPVSVAIDCHLPQSVTTSPPVPVPMPAVVLLAVALLAAGLLTGGRRSVRRD